MAYRFESGHRHQNKRERLKPLSFILCAEGERTRTHLNAARASAAGEGLTEPLLDSIESVTGNILKQGGFASLLFLVLTENGLEPI